MNTPTKITVARIFLTIIVLFLMWDALFSLIGFNFPKYNIGGVLVQLNYVIAGVIFVIASLTDFLDGYLARKNNQVTDLGKMLDAIADKFLVSPVLIVLAANSFIPTIVPVVYIMRDIVVDAIKMQTASKGKVQAAIKTGKYKTACMMIGITLVFFYNIPFEFYNINVAYGLLYIACILAIVSAVEYYLINRKILFEKTKN